MMNQVVTQGSQGWKSLLQHQVVFLVSVATSCISGGKNRPRCISGCCFYLGPKNSGHQDFYISCVEDPYYAP